MLSTLIGIVLTLFSVETVEPSVYAIRPQIKEISEVQLAVIEPSIIAPVEATTTQSTPTPLVEADNPLCSCILFLRLVMGVPIKGNASELIPNTGEIKVGNVVLFQLKEKHVGLITEKNGQIISGVEANRSKCKKTNWTVDLGNPEQTKTIAGFINPMLAKTVSKSPF